MGWRRYILYQYPRGSATENLASVVIYAPHTYSLACALRLFECVTLAKRAFLAVPHSKAFEGSSESIAVLLNRVRLLPVVAHICKRVADGRRAILRSDTLKKFTSCIRTLHPHARIHPGDM